MRKLLPIAIASAIWALPASAGDGIPFKPEVTLAQLLDLCVGSDCRDRGRVYRDDRYDDDWRFRDGANWRYYRGGVCRDVTFREQRGGEVVIRHERRCD